MGLLLACASTLAAAPPTNQVLRLAITEAADQLFAPVAFRPGAGRSAHSHVGQIVEDRAGFLWIGTEDGLKRYDSYRFLDFRPDSRNPNSLQGVAVNALFQDRNGYLWVASDDYLDRFDPATETFAHFPAGPRPEGPIAHINQDREGVIWLCTAHGLVRMEPSTGKSTRFHHDPNDPTSLTSDVLRSTFEERDGTFWVAGARDLDVFDRRTGQVTRHVSLYNSRRGRAASAANESVSLFEDHAGVLWVASARDGLAMFDHQRQALTFLALDPGARASTPPGAYAVREDRHNVLWVGANGGGLLRLDPERKSFVRYRNDPRNPDSLASNQVVALLEDHEDGLWIGTGGGGLTRIPTRPIPFERYWRNPGGPCSLGTDYVTAVFKDSHGIVWAGGKGAMTRIDREIGRCTVYRLEGYGSSADIVSIAEERPGRLWLGTRGGGLYRLDLQTGGFKLYRHDPSNPSSLSYDTVFALHIDRHGNLWVGAADGLDAYDPRTDSFRVYHPAGDVATGVRAIAEDAGGNFWLATRHSGVRRFEPSTGRFTSFHSSPSRGSLSSNAVAAILVDHTGAVWAGTENGLDRLDPGGNEFTVLYERDGLPNSNINGILEDSRGGLWITTHNGLSHYDRESNQFRNYYRKDGVLGDFATAWKSPDGEMFFGAYTGLTALVPEKLTETSYAPPVVLTGFQLSDKPVLIGGGSPLRQSITMTQSLTLNHEQNFFSFEFSAIGFINPERTRYRYRLEGLSDNWNEVDSAQRFARYTSVKPGTYTFRVESRTSLTGWDEPGKALRIVVLPPWWETMPFQAACVLVVGLMVWAVFQLRVRQLARQLSSRFEERLDERTRIAGELHDTLLQGFLSASMQLDVAADALPEDSPLKPKLAHILKLMSRVTAEGRNTVQGLRSSEGDSMHLEQALAQIEREFDTGGAAALHVIVEGSSRPLHPIFRDEVYRIGREAVINAFRHSGAKTIEAVIEYSRGQFRLEVRDDGCGIDDEVSIAGREGHWGLPGMRERAKRIGAEFHVWSRAGGGTIVEMKAAGAIAYRPEGPEREGRFRLRRWVWWGRRRAV